MAVLRLLEPVKSSQIREQHQVIGSPDGRCYRIVRRRLSEKCRRCDVVQLLKTIPSPTLIEPVAKDTNGTLAEPLTLFTPSYGSSADLSNRA